MRHFHRFFTGSPVKNSPPYSRHIWFSQSHNAGGAGGRDRVGDAAAADDDDLVVGDLLGEDDDDEDDDDGWNKLPIITFQTFDDLTSGTATARTSSSSSNSGLPDGKI